MKTIMAIDQGTSSTRAIIFGLDGVPLASASVPFDNTFPADGWVEQDPEVLWQSTLRAGREALANAGLTGHDVAAIGITNQRETTLLWEASGGRCLHEAIVWQDRRTADLCSRLLADGLGDTVAGATGLLIDPYFSATKLTWLLDRYDPDRQRAASGELCFGTVDSFLIWRLTGGSRHVTDATNASRTMLFDIHDQCWSELLLDAMNVPPALMPEVLDSAAEFGTADPAWFGAAIPILGVAGDQQAALIGQACFEPGMVKSTYGTGCFLISNTGARPLHSTQQLLATVAYRIGGEVTYALEGSIFSAGVAIKWLRDQLGLISDAAETEAAARRCDGDTQGVYLVPAFTGLGAPHWAPDARGLMTGMTLDTHADHIITATLASVVYQTLDLVDAVIADGADVAGLRVDGGMVVNDWLCQFLADIVQRPVERPVNVETTALGAAVLAAVGGNHVADLSSAASMWHLDQTFTPSMEAELRDRSLNGWRKAVQRALH